MFISKRALIKQLDGFVENHIFTTHCFFASAAVLQRCKWLTLLHLELASVPTEPSDHSDDADWMQEAADTHTHTRITRVYTHTVCSHSCESHYSYTIFLSDHMSESAQCLRSKSDSLL